MSTRRVSVDEFEAALYDELNLYASEVSERVNTAVDVVAKEANEEVKQRISFKQRTGDYVKAFRITTIENTKLRKVKVWHVSDPEYRLTHLLEYGHAKPGGGRTQAYPHIQYGEELAQRRMEELAREAANP